MFLGTRILVVFFFNDTATTEIYTLSLHDALPIFGEPRGGESARVTALAARLTTAGFETSGSPCIQADVWYKLWGNMTMNPMSALTGATCDRLLDDPLLDRFTLASMARAAAIRDRIRCPSHASGGRR